MAFASASRIWGCAGSTLSKADQAVRIAVLGLGEAGSLLAADLARAGDEVHGYDPAAVSTPDGVARHRRPEDAVRGCEMVMAITPGSEALTTLDGARQLLMGDIIYADLSTSTPLLKTQLAGIVQDRGGLFADVALMSPIPGLGLKAPALVSGSGAEAFATLINARGGNVEVVGAEAGEAATRKLLRSVVMKGLSALLIEAMTTARLTGHGEWLWAHLVEQLTTIDETLMRRLLLDAARHAPRRVEEIEAALQLMTHLGQPAFMTTATIAHLEHLITDGGIDFSLDPG